MTDITAVRALQPDRLEHLELLQERTRYSGVDLRMSDARYGQKDKPWSLTLFANDHGSFETSFNLTRDEAEAMRDWLNDLLAKLDAGRT